MNEQNEQNEFEEHKFNSTDYIAAVETIDGFVFLKAVGDFGTVRLVPSVENAIGFNNLKALRKYLGTISKDSHFGKNYKIYVRRVNSVIVQVKSF